ncbi:MAG: glycosyltransferase family 39 protein [Lapillicoccus sp.]
MTTSGPASALPAPVGSRRPPIAWRPLMAAIGALAVVLTATSAGYGYHRDELYFRMLQPGWGYVDQPPLTPLLARLTASVVDQPWAMRVPATIAALATVLLVALLTREVGGGGRAQALAAWGYAFAAFPLVFGHLLLTVTPDLLAWSAVALLVVRAVLRDEGRAWLWAGVVAGAATWNKFLIVLLVVSLAAGLVAVGPRRLPWRWVVAGVVAGALVASPNLLYQATHGWPQLTMGRQLGAGHGSEIRPQLVPFLGLLLGPPLVVVWGAGWWGLLRRPEWRRMRFLAVAFPVLVVLSLVAGAQVYYPLGLLTVLYAVGCVPAARVSPSWWVTLRIAVVVNALVSAVIALPLVPLGVLGSTPVPGINQAARDQVGWPAYVAQVARVRDGLPAGERGSAIVIAGNYGEAGALDRYGPATGLPLPLSGHNALWSERQPPPTRVTAIVVSEGAVRTAETVATCTVVAHLDNGVDVDNEEQDQPIALCRNPTRTWLDAWPAFRHLD